MRLATEAGRLCPPRLPCHARCKRSCLAGGTAAAQWAAWRRLNAARPSGAAGCCPPVQRDDARAARARSSSVEWRGGSNRRADRRQPRPPWFSAPPHCRLQPLAARPAFMRRRRATSTALASTPWPHNRPCQPTSSRRARQLRTAAAAGRTWHSSPAGDDSRDRKVSWKLSTALARRPTTTRLSWGVRTSARMSLCGAAAWAGFWARWRRRRRGQPKSGGRQLARQTCVTKQMQHGLAALAVQAGQQRARRYRRARQGPGLSRHACKQFWMTARLFTQRASRCSERRARANATSAPLLLARHAPTHPTCPAGCQVAARTGVAGHSC